MGSRRTDAPVAKPPANFSEAVEEVKQWNQALKSPTGAEPIKSSGRLAIASLISPRRGSPLRNCHNEQQFFGQNLPSTGFLQLAKLRNSTEAFRSPENKGQFKFQKIFVCLIFV